jgi:hypothetical protein
MWRAAALLALLSAPLMSCAGDDNRFPVVITVSTDDGKPFEGVPVTIGKALAGKTDEKGRLRVPLVGKEGQRFKVSVPTPTGFRAEQGDRPLVLRNLGDIEGGGGRRLPIEHVVRFIPLERQYAVLVRVGVPGLPVETFGTERAVTNSRGVAMFLYRGAPGDELKVRISTASRPELRPQNPSATFMLASRTEAYVVREHFTSTAPLKPVRRLPKPVRIRRL